jgi:outer membrane assembly lipoprotein YfiO
MNGKGNLMKKLFFAILTVTLAAGCGSFPSTEGMDRDGIIRLADDFFQREKWSQASFLYTELMFRYPGDLETDLFLYRIGIADREQKLWADAEYFLYRVVNEFPNGPWADDAQLALAETMWMQRRDFRRDQTQVMRAREELLRFFRDYPSSSFRGRAEELLTSVNDHLARRSLFVGNFYLRRNQTDASILYLRDALDSYGETSCRGAALIAMGNLYGSLGNTYSARTYYNRALDTCDLTPQEEEEARRGLERLR